MICKYCGNEIPDGSKLCFVCNKVLLDVKAESRINKSQANSAEKRYLMPYHYGKGFETYKDIKRKFIFNIIFAPVLLVVIWMLYLYIHPIAAIAVIIVTVIMVPKEMSAQYKVIKENKKKNGKS